VMPQATALLHVGKVTGVAIASRDGNDRFSACAFLPD
jgi:hypothetical protein